MRLIDAEAYEQALIANDWDKDTDEFSTEGVFELLHDETTVQAIPLDKVKQAREEIDKLIDQIREEYDYGMAKVYGGHLINGINLVIPIVDKLIGEAEE